MLMECTECHHEEIRFGNKIIKQANPSLFHFVALK